MIEQNLYENLYAEFLLVNPDIKDGSRIRAAFRSELDRLHIAYSKTKVSLNGSRSSAIAPNPCDPRGATTQTRVDDE